MDPFNPQDFALDMLRDAAIGISFLAVVLFVNVFFFMKILFWFTRKGEKDLKPSAYRLMGRFMVAVFLMCITQVFAILLWTAAIHMNGLVPNVRAAMLFAGSCYTTLGIISDDLPLGWQSLAFYIAFSGLFSFAIATAAMIAMLGTVSKRAYEEEYKKEPPL